MAVMRSALLAASRSVWLRERATRYRFVRRAVSRFMPGETIDDALEAARQMRGLGIASILTCLGENVSNEREAANVADHYVDAFGKAQALGLDAEISVKLTHLGLDLGGDVAAANLMRVARRAQETRRRLWVDMEDSSYTSTTLDIFRRVRPQHPAMGVALQAYLHRTREDIESLLPLGPAIRLVKGAYREPPHIAMPRKKDVDESYFELAKRLLSETSRQAGTWIVFGTHDPVLIQRILDHAREHGVPKETFEFDLLYGIRRDLQERLARDRYRVRVLISYGSFWFPWYMRRLAERPANVWFLARTLFAR